jgi:hypothetical protein
MAFDVVAAAEAVTIAVPIAAAKDWYGGELVGARQQFAANALAVVFPMQPYLMPNIWPPVRDKPEKRAI